MDIIVVGGGIAGVSLAYELAFDRKVLLLEGEKSLAMHTTGRSAATWIRSYGPPLVRQYTAESFDFLADPPLAVDGPLLTDLECLWIGTQAEADDVRKLADETGTELIDGTEAERLNPFLRPGRVALAAFDRTAKDLDVAGLHHAYARAFHQRGGEVRTRSRVVAAEGGSGGWTLTLGDGEQVTAATVVIAAGAWGDVVGGLFGAAPLGLQPRRRSIFISPTARPVTGMPFTAAVDDSFYIRPEGAGVLGSPQDATGHEPGDPKPDELEIARAIEAVNDATTLGLRSVSTAWAGLRTFAPDGLPVVRWDSSVEGLFWFVGQGGYGIQMAPALARHGRALIEQ